MTVGKTFVATVLQQRQHELAAIRRRLKHKKPKPMPPNIVWALDLTYTGEPRRKRTVLGLLDHGSRACLALSDLRNKTSVAILRAILDAIELFGKPRSIRTDNESVFTSNLFRLGLRLLGIRHQRTAPFAPWQNGRVERFFKTFKELVRRWPVQQARNPKGIWISFGSGTTMSALISISTVLLPPNSGRTARDRIDRIDRIDRRRRVTSRHGMGF